MYIHLFNFITEHETEKGFMESDFYKTSVETKNLCEKRILEETEEIIELDTSEFFKDYENVKDLIDKIKNNFKNLRRIMSTKSDDQMKIDLLEKVDAQFSEQYKDLMNLTREFY